MPVDPGGYLDLSMDELCQVGHAVVGAEEVVSGFEEGCPERGRAGAGQVQRRHPWLGRELRLRETCRTLADAKMALTKLQGHVDERKHPESGITVRERSSSGWTSPSWG